MKPRIGLTSFSDAQPKGEYSSLNVHYTRSVADSGGLPFIIPAKGNADDSDEVVACLDGLILTGGKDLDPVLYGEDPIKGIRAFDDQRDEREYALLRAALKKNIPILGICRGHQLINVALGGSLWQDIWIQKPGSLGHYPEDFPMDRLYHFVELAEDSILREVFGQSRIRVNSFHHQTVKELGANLKATAYSADGLIEGFESTEKGRFIIGVQFHPEGLTGRFPEFLKLFARFAEACRVNG